MMITMMITMRMIRKRRIMMNNDDNDDDNDDDDEDDDGNNSPLPGPYRRAPPQGSETDCWRRSWRERTDSRMLTLRLALCPAWSTPNTDWTVPVTTGDSGEEMG